MFKVLLVAGLIATPASCNFLEPESSAPPDPVVLMVGSEQVKEWRSISRYEYDILLQMTGGIDELGRFREPVPLERVGLNPEEMPYPLILMNFEWDPVNGIVLRIQDGHITQQVFYIPPEENY